MINIHGGSSRHGAIFHAANRWRLSHSYQRFKDSSSERQFPGKTRMNFHGNLEETQ